ncbi:hypothetical protein XENOCAPTIV_005689 [Xenoophorus captivus]|uniref:Uncharacterized protein n=1 Tax=Xenoophorus captivus TaxID=1517983 RepID=A0ABV0QYN3_9TELE
MAFGPGGSSNLAYVVLCGGGLTAAVVYAYKTVNGDTERYEDRLANMSSKEKEIINSFVDEESLVNALHQMSADGNDLNSLEGFWEPEALGAVSELSTKETAEAAVDSEEENQLRLRKEEEERATSFPEVEDNTMMPDSAPKEAISSSEAYPEDSFSSDEAWHAEEVIVTAEATKEEEETKSEEIKFGTVGKTTQLAAASTKPNLEVLSAAEPESPSSMGPVDKEQPCHNCHNCSPSSEAPPPALGEDMPAMDLAHEAKDKSSPLTKQRKNTAAVFPFNAARHAGSKHDSV